MQNSKDQLLMARVAWFYYLGGLNQEETAKRVGLTRARVNKLLQEARDTGLVSITIDQRNFGLLPIEDKITKKYNLDFCITTPPLELSKNNLKQNPNLNKFAFSAVGSAAAHYLRDFLNNKPDAIVGLGWGRTLEHITQHLSGVNMPKARFISLMGSLTANSSFNPFEVVQALARITGAEGYFLPVPFIADSAKDREVLLSQQAVARPLALANKADLVLISVGELTEQSLLRQQNMISEEDLISLREAGAVGDTNGIFFDVNGTPVKHSLNERTLAVGFDVLQRSNTIVLSSGCEKIEATLALLKSGVPSGLIIDGDSACVLAKELEA